MNSEEQIVYVLINEAMPGYTKIGLTSNLEQRIRSLDNTSTPLPFECVYAAVVNDARFVEGRLHDAFGDHRVRSNREFFEIDPERVVSALELAMVKDVTPDRDYVETEEDQHALDKAKQRKSAFNFAMVGIQPGSILVFSRNPDITCVVVDKKNVEYKGKEMSLSAAALDVFADTGFSWKQVRGPQYWEYEGETLVERRTRLEREE